MEAPMTTPPPAGPTAERVCSYCEGSGWMWLIVPRVACPRCNGTGIAAPDEEGGK